MADPAGKKDDAYDRALVAGPLDPATITDPRVEQVMRIMSPWIFTGETFTEYLARVSPDALTPESDDPRPPAA